MASCWWSRTSRSSFPARRISRLPAVYQSESVLAPMLLYSTVFAFPVEICGTVGLVGHRAETQASCVLIK